VADSGFCPLEDAALVRGERESTTIVGLAKNERFACALGPSCKENGLSASTKRERREKSAALHSILSIRLRVWDPETTGHCESRTLHKKALIRVYVFLTNLEGRAQALYDEIYCARGEMGKIASRKTTTWSPSVIAPACPLLGGLISFRLLLSFVGLRALRSIASAWVSGTQLARAQVE